MSAVDMPMPPTTFYIRFDGGLELDSENIWPDDDGPDDPGPQDVARLMRTWGSVTAMLDGWGVRNNLEVWVDDVKVWPR